MRRRDPTSPEPKTASGAALLTHNHVMLLQALIDRPHATVDSYEEWLVAAMPIARVVHTWPSEHCLRRGMRTVNAAWVKRRRHGSSIAVTLTERGRAILEQRVAAHVHSYGPYLGLATIRARRAEAG